MLTYDSHREQYESRGSTWNNKYAVGWSHSSCCTVTVFRETLARCVCVLVYAVQRVAYQRRPGNPGVSRMSG